MLPLHAVHSRGGPEALAAKRAQALSVRTRKVLAGTDSARLNSQSSASVAYRQLRASSSFGTVLVNHWRRFDRRSWLSGAVPASCEASCGDLQPGTAISKATTAYHRALQRQSRWPGPTGPVWLSTGCQWDWYSSLGACALAPNYVSSLFPVVALLAPLNERDLVANSSPLAP